MNSQNLRSSSPLTPRVVALQALAGTLLGLLLGFLGAFAGPWLADAVRPGSGGDPLLSSLFGTFIGSIIGAALGVYLAGRALAQRGALWATILGSGLGAVLGYGLLSSLGWLERSVLNVWGLIGGGALLLALVGYTLTRRTDTAV